VTPTIVGADISTDVVDLMTGLAWPVLLAVVIWRLMPLIRDVLASRGFTVHAGGMEISVQEASTALGERIEDVREQVSAIKQQLDGSTGESDSRRSSPLAQGLPALSSVIWVDDFPENNAFEVETLRRKGVRVTQARSTTDALRRLDAQPSFSAVITDMGRTENGESKSEAGIDLIAGVRERDPDVPIFVYASAPAIARSGPSALTAGATFATSSATELLEALGRLGLARGDGSEPLHRPTA
jgi:CheY-like chemotaxis protein